MKVAVVAILLGAFLAGCAAQLVSSNPRSVIVKAPPAKVADAQGIADAECAKFKRFARMTARPAGYSSEFVFSCDE